MAKVKLTSIMTEVLWERCLLNQRSIQLEQSLTKEEKIHGIFKEYVSYVKNVLNTEQLTSFKNFFNPTLTEDLSDDDMAELIAQAARELANKLPDAKYLTDPEKIHIDALEKGDVEQGIEIDGQESSEDVQTESYRTKKRILTEAGVLMTILALPAIGKLIANVIDWVKRNLTFPSTESIKEGEIIDILTLIHAYAKSNNKIPTKQIVADLAKKTTFDKLDKLISFINKKAKTDYKSPNIKTPIFDEYELSYSDPEAALMKNIDMAFDRINDAVTADAEKNKGHKVQFSPKGSKVQPADDHMIHILNSMTYSSPVAKSLANASHTLHEWILKTVGTIMTPIFAVRYGLFSKAGWKKAWDKSHQWANVMYITAMGAYLGWHGIKALLTDSDILGFIKGMFESVEKFVEASKDIIKTGDLSVAAVEEFLAVSGALQED